MTYKIESIYATSNSFHFREFEITPERISNGNSALSFTEEGTKAVLLQEKEYDTLDEAVENHPSASVFKYDEKDDEKKCQCGHSIDLHDHARANFGGCIAPCLVPNCACRDFYYDWEEWTDWDAQDI